MQYTPHYNLNLPEGTDIVNPLIQDNPNYLIIDTALYNNKLRVIGTATHTKTGTNHSIVLADSDIPVFRFVATGDYAVGDTFSVDGVTVTARLADGKTPKKHAFIINSTVLAVLDGTLLNLIGIDSAIDSDEVSFDNSGSDLSSIEVESAIKEVNTKVNDIKYNKGTIKILGAAIYGGFYISLDTGKNINMSDIVSVTKLGDATEYKSFMNKESYSNMNVFRIVASSGLSAGDQIMITWN